MVTGRPFISRKMPMKSPFCMGRILARARLAPFQLFGQDHLAHGGDALGIEEHVLGAAQADALGAEFAGHLGVMRGVGIGADLHACGTCPTQVIRVPKSPVSWTGTVGTAPSMTSPVEPSRVIMSPFLTTTPFLAVNCLGIVIDLDVAAAGHAAFAHAARHNRRVGGHAAAGGQDALGGVHAVDVFGRGFDADQDDLAAELGLCLGLVGGEDDLAGGRAR